MHIFRYANGVLPNSLALAYIIITYPLALWGLAVSGGMLYLVWCLLLAHTLVISAYLIHECIHNTIFRKSRHNRWLGQALAWLTGAAYTPYTKLQTKHLRHHADRVDVLALDCREILRARPWLAALMVWMQRLYLPAAEILTHGLSMAAPFLLESRRGDRTYLLGVLLSRILFFSLLASINLALLPGYLLAWLVFVTVLGFMDTFQHHYEVRLRLDEDKPVQEFDRDYEETHTFSNLLSQRFPLVNLLVLNFCYHNVHHYKSGIPWHELPAAHARRYQNSPAPLISLHDQLRNYHRYRVERLQSGTPIHPDSGAAGVSFLVGV